MAITQGNTTFASSVVSSDVTVTVPSAVSNGDVLVAAYSKFSSTGFTPGSWTFDFGTWVETALDTTLDSLHTGVAVLVVDDAAALPSAITFGFGGGNLFTAVASLTAYSGVDNGNPVAASDNNSIGNVTGATLPALDVTSDGSKYVGLAVQTRENTLTFDTLTRFLHELGANTTSTENIRHAVADGDVDAGTAVSVGSWSSSDANTRPSSHSGLVLNPEAAGGQLATPTNFTFTAGSGTAEVSGSWSSVTDADTYDYEVEEWDGTAWQAFALSAVTAPTTSFTLTSVDGVTLDTTYRARVRAVPAV